MADHNYKATTVKGKCSIQLFGATGVESNPDSIKQALQLCEEMRCHLEQMMVSRVTPLANCIAQSIETLDGVTATEVVDHKDPETGSISLEIAVSTNLTPDTGVGDLLDILIDDYMLPNIEDLGSIVVISTHPQG